MASIEHWRGKIMSYCYFLPRFFFLSPLCMQMDLLYPLISIASCNMLMLYPSIFGRLPTHFGFWKMIHRNDPFRDISRCTLLSFSRSTHSLSLYGLNWTSLHRHRALWLALRRLSRLHFLPPPRSPPSTDNANLNSWLFYDSSRKTTTTTMGLMIKKKKENNG